ncbi:uncharacterized protein LOC135582597 isoform X2 [Musa acuminata AAA Group]|uniref:uncharacterized protein LOC135582597 isoform X2 n=1 Tax=Musa acuminata AAA Group TaxID=214697 RepID=UPI0031CEBBC6
MGANCCVAVKDKHLPSPAQFDVSTYRTVRHSPTWSFRWDNRTHIEDVIDNAAQFCHQHSGNTGLEIKSESPTEAESPYDRGSPSNVFQLQKQLIFPSRTGTAGKLKDVAADPSTSRSRSLPSDPTSSRKACRSPGYQLCRQISDSRIPSLQSRNENSSPEGRKSFVLSFCSNDLSTGGSHGGSSDGWSMCSFSELVASSNRERLSFDSDNLNFFSSQLTESNPQQTTQVFPDQQTCRVCSKQLTKHCVVAVLVCGHLYHAECLEKMTSEIDQYDPTCPVCTHGEKAALKLFTKAESKAKNKLSRIGIADSDAQADALCDRQNRAAEGPRMEASSNMKSSFGRPFLRRRFSFGRPSWSASESEANRKKGFWERCRRE